MTRKYIIGSILIFVMLVMACVVVIRHTRRSDTTPKTVEWHTATELLNVHDSPQRGLNVFGRTFKNIMGGPPYYLTVSNTDFLIFAYQPDTESRYLVLCNTNDRTFKEIRIPRNILFGGQIGYWEATHGKGGDHVEVVNSNTILLLNHSFEYEESSLLDIAAGTIKLQSVGGERGTIIIDLPSGTN